MTRRLPLALAVAGLVVTGSACGAVDDADVIARVGDAELTRSEFEDRLTELGATDDQVLAGEPVRAEITRWIQLELAGAAEIAATYALGADESGVVCVSAIVVEDEPTAEAVLGELEGGAPFAEVFATANRDQSLAATGGALPCLTSSDIVESAEVAFVVVGGERNADDPFGISPVNDTQGNVAAWVVLAFRPFDELSPEDADAVLSVVGATIDTSDVEVHVAPRYGVYDPAAGRVVALG